MLSPINFKNTLTLLSRGIWRGSVHVCFRLWKASLWEWVRPESPSPGRWLSGTLVKHGTVWLISLMSSQRVLELMCLEDGRWKQTDFCFSDRGIKSQCFLSWRSLSFLFFSASFSFTWLSLTASTVASLCVQREETVCIMEPLAFSWWLVTSSSVTMDNGLRHEPSHKVSLWAL